MKITSLSRYLYLASYLIRHKYYVFIECWKKGLYWRGIVHDLDKFSPSKFTTYAKSTGGNLNYGLTKTGFSDIDFGSDPEYYNAVMRHRRGESHHWESWIFLDKNSNAFIMPMDNDSIVEMIIDWKCASKARRKKEPFGDWYWLNKEKILLHEETRARVEELLAKEI